MAQMTSRRTMNKHYAQGVIAELQHLGYPAEKAKEVFFRHYRDMKRTFGLEPNVGEFAKMVDDFERAMQRKTNPNDPNRIFVGHLHDREKTKKQKVALTHSRLIAAHGKIAKGIFQKRYPGIVVIKVDPDKRKVRQT